MNRVAERRQENTAQPHGTVRRYHAGCSCAKCRRANREAKHAHTLARTAAQRALAREYPERYRELYEQECVERGVALRPVGRPPRSAV